MLLMCSISCPLQRWLDMNFSNSNRPNKVCKLHTFWNKNVTCYSSFSFWIFLFKFYFLTNFYQFFEIFIGFFIKFIFINFLSNLFVNYWFWINHRSIAAIICSAHHILNAVTVRNVHHKNIAAATIIHICKAQLS